MSDRVTSPLTIWCNAKLTATQLASLRVAIEPHRVILPTDLPAFHLHRGEPDPQLATADIAFGQPDPDQIVTHPGVKWVEISSAGYTRYDTEAFTTAMRSRGGAFTNSSSVYDDPCAQHVLAMMLAVARQLPAAVIDQQNAKSWPHNALRYDMRLLTGKTVILYGFGAIGRRLVELLAPFRMTLIAARRNPSPAPGVRVVTVQEADALLPMADYLVNLLPASPETERLINAERLSRLTPGARYFTVGRGSTTDQPALIEALRSGRLAFAYLDVTTPEPLPADSPLWTTPNCYITPHIAGGREDELICLIDHFAENLRRYTSGKELIDRIL